MEFSPIKTFSHKLAILLLWVYVLGICLADDSLIDDDHLEQYPFCGKMNYPANTHGASARVVNSKDDKDNYRWVAFIARKEKQKNGSWKRHRCSGSIITER